MDAIDRAFTTASMGGNHFSLPIKVTLDLGKCIINKYYNLTDESEIYQVSIGMSAVFSTSSGLCLTLFIVLHPRLKTQYFKDNKWPQAWQNDAIAITQRIFDNEYQSSSLPDDIPSSSKRASETNKVSTKYNCFLYFY